MSKRKTFYFDTGVRPIDNSHLFKGQVWRNGTKQIPFEVEDVPDNAIFMFACDNPNLPESKQSNVIVRRMYNTDMLSTYAYFIVPAQTKEEE